jgi:hypothetical protein
MKEFEDMLKERQTVLSGKEKNLHEIKSQLAQVNRKLETAKKLSAQKEAVCQTEFILFSRFVKSVCLSGFLFFFFLLAYC